MSSEFFDMTSGSWIAPPEDDRQCPSEVEFADAPAPRLQAVAGEDTDTGSPAQDWLRTLDVNRLIDSHGH